MNSYYIIMTMEVEVPKSNLNLGIVDRSGTVKEYALEQLRTIYPSDIYDYTELYGSHVFSFKGSLMSKPIMQLRDAVYSALDIDFDNDEIIEEEKLKNELKNVTVSDMIRLCQPRFFDFDRPYDFFLWKEYYGSSIELYTNADHKFKGRASIIGRGIQIYRSKEFFTSEISGDFELLSVPLRNLLNSLPYSDIVSARIDDN